MATQPTQSSDGPPRLPLLASMSNRGETPDVDARLINGYVEKNEVGVMAIKRPGVFPTLSSPGAGLGIYTWEGDFYSASGGHLYKNSVDVGVINDTAGIYTFSSKLGATPQLFLHNTGHAYHYDSVNGLVSITAVPPIPSAVPGQAFLDGTTYVMDPKANIYGSGINDLDTWDPLNLIVAQMEPDGGVFIGKQLAYVIALKQWTTEAFYDAGNAAGSPLASAPGTLITYGCRSAGSVQNFEGILLWVAATRNGSVCVISLENMRAQIISTPPVERLLQQADFTTTWSWSARISGHRFYVVTVKNANLTLVYDLTTKEWFQWTDTNGNYLPFVSSSTTTDRQKNLLQHESDGQIYELESTNTNDNGAPITFDLYTPNATFGSKTKKLLQRMDFYGDQKGMGTLQVRFSEDDYKSWSNFRSVDLSTTTASLWNNGTFRKRAWHLRHQDDTPLRLQFVELTLLQGSV